MTQYVQLSDDTTKVIAWYAGPQATTADKPGYAEIPDNDSRYVAWQEFQSALGFYKEALDAGIDITSTATPGLDGTYPIDAETQRKIAAEQTYIAAAGKFTNGQTSHSWPDAGGSLHNFPSTGDFTSFAEAVAGYVDSLSTALQAVEAGGAWVAPASAAAIP